jgi:four helix bundle protein
VAETRNWLDLAKECGYISEEDFVELDEKCIEITKMLLGYVKSVRKQIENSNTK